MKKDLIFPKGKLVAGFDGRIGVLDNTYHDMLTGTAADYAAHSGALGGISTQGDGRRRTMAGFLQYSFQPHARLRWMVGGRYDAIQDQYRPAGGEERDASHRAFSPKVGMNIAFARSRGHMGHVYANYLGLFKVATMDQLFDQRLLPVPFPPFSITISNAALKPQRGISYEAGVYQRVALASTVTSELTLSVYQVDMNDELDFSFETFSYANIAASRHVGVEGGLQLFVDNRITAHVNYTLQNVTYEKGQHRGNHVKGIPRDYLNAGVSASLPMRLHVGVIMHVTKRMYLDDANTSPLEDYSTLDVMASYRWPRWALKLEATNMLDATYSTTGFPDPDSASESGVVFLYPAAGRALRLGVTVSL